MTKVTLLETDEQKILAQLQGKTVITTTEMAINYTQQYTEQFKEHREKQGKPVVKHNDAMIKVFYLVDALLEQMDVLIDDAFFVQKTKQIAKNFVQQLEKYNQNIYSCSESGNNKIREIIAEQFEIHNIVSNIHNLYYTELLELLKKYEDGHKTELIVKDILNTQYAMFKDFELPDIVRKQVLRVEENADNFNILHLAEVVTREKVMALKQLNPKTLDVLDKIFRNAQIKW